MRKTLFALLIILTSYIGSVYGQCSASISGPTGIVCTGDQVTLTAMVSPPDPGNCSTSVNITNTTTTVTCGSPICFYDSGGPSGNYGTSESYIHTFTSNNGSPVTITFLSANGETCCDYIYVYDGAGTAGTQLHYGLLSTVNGNVTYTSTGNSLTVKFTSDGSVCYDGWQAIISCDACSNYTYNWSNGATGQTITVSPTTQTTYTCTISSEGCCNTTASFTINPTNCVNNCNGFETTADRAEWTLVNGSQTNQWVMNTGVNNGGQYSLYVTNAPTSATPAHSYTNTSTYVWAYKDIEFPECDDDFVLAFDWIAYGESCCDYMYVYIGAPATVTAGSSTAPTGATQLNNPTTSSVKFNVASTWQHFETQLSSATYSGQIMRLYFMWHNDGSVQTMPPAGVDNVCIQSCEPCNQPVVNVTPESALLCQGESVTFTATVTGGSGHGYTYEWTPATGLSSTNTATTTATPMATTTYSLRVTDSEDCAKTVRIPVEISGTTLEITQSPAVYCRGTDPVTLNAVLNVSGSCSNYTYAWSNGPSGAVSTDVPQQNTTYTVTATPVGGDCCTLTATHTVEVGDCNQDCNDFETPTGRAEWTLVNGTQTNQWVTGTGTNNGGQYALYVSNSPTAATPPNSYTNTATTVWAYKEIEFPECEEDFVLSFDWKCGGESSLDYMSIFIGEEATVTAGSTTQPAGSTRLLNMDATSATYQSYFNTYGNYNDQWHHTEIILDHETYSGQYMLLYFMWHNDGSVQNYSPAAVDNVCIQACIPCDQPVVTVTPASVILCQGESVDFTASATGGSGGGYTFTWSPAGSLNTTNGPTVTATPEETTVYRVRVTDGEGCAKTVRVTAEVSGTRLNVQATPAGFCAGSTEPVTITANLQVEGSCSSYTYAWSNGATGTTINDQPTITTSYTVTATPTDPSCCELIASATVAVMDCAAEGCPSVSPAELGTNNVDINIDCSSQPEVTLSANVMATAVEADDYFVFSIPYNPPYGYTDGTRIFANATDDTWSSVVNLPFTFCYYGNTYTQIVAGANSVATFNTSVAGNSCAWSYDESIPDANLFPNTIFACYRDIYPSTSDYVASTGDGGIFEGVLGEYPCRSYVLSFNNIKLFSCTEIRTFTSMIVLYEGTNVIDIYLRDAPTCTSWNDGNGVIGLQNADCSRGITPPGRNTGPWTAHEEAWRFMPTGQPSYTVTWYQGQDTSANGIVLGHGDLLTVTPTESTDYTARLQYTACNGDYFDIVNRCHVTVNNSMPTLTVVASKDTLCPNEEVTIEAFTETPISYRWNTGDTVPRFTLVPEDVITTYTVTVTYENGCSRSDSVTVYAVASIDPPTFTLDPNEDCAGSRFVITANDYAQYRWSNGATTQSITVYPQVTTTYSLTVSDEVGCSSSAETQVVVHPIPQAAFAPERFLTYLEDGGADVQFLDFSEGASNWLYDFGDQWSNSNTSIDQSPIHTYTHSGIYTVTQWVTSDFGCMDSVTRMVSIQKPFYFYVPNAFTPDGDGINEIWLPQGEGVDESNYVCMVFDRNGRLIFKTNSLTQGWDGRDQHGKAVPCASYVYVIQTSTMDATPKEFTGTVTVVR